MTGIFYSPKRRYRLYIDETGTDSMKSTKIDRHLALMGIVFRQDVHDNAVHPRLEKIKEDLFGHCVDNNPVILHRSEVVRSKGVFAALDDPQIKREFNSRFLSIVSEAPYRAIAAAIDKDEHIEKYIVWQHDPYHYCMECILERYSLWLNRNDLHGDVMIEARGKKKDRRLKEAYVRFYNNGNNWCDAAMVQNRLISKEPKFSTKQDNVSALQLSDLMAQPVHRFMRGQQLNEPLPNDFG